jgi:hypothetical protein
VGKWLKDLKNEKQAPNSEKALFLELLSKRWQILPFLISTPLIQAIPANRGNTAFLAAPGFLN